MKHFKINFEPDKKQITVHADATITEAAGLAGIILNTPCGGKGICRKCKVYISPGNREVLACNYRIQRDLTVTIPSESRYFEQKILHEGIESNKRKQNDIYQKYSRISKDIELFGLAIDIGTTTIVVKLVDLIDGNTLATQASLNPQSQYGDDVISRIAYAASREGAIILQKTVIDCINDLIEKLCEQKSINYEQIFEVCAVGNTTMSHIFLGLPVEQLGYSPYEAYSLDSYDKNPAELNLKINPAGNIHTVENIAGFVGSDATAVAVAAEIDAEEKTTLIIDIGTNGEIILGTKDKLYAASCAAGPAFEGGRINCGSRAVIGAIETVILNDNDIDFDVIGDAQAGSICGSGLIDAAAVMLELGIIEKSGRFADINSLKTVLPPAIFKRLKKHNEEFEFFLSEFVFINQSDIRQIQLAKAAIMAGIKFLQVRLNVTNDDIEQVLLAGAFGNYIRKQSAIRIGLIPDIAIEKIKFIGNAAASGAQMILLSSENRQKAKETAKKIQYIELAAEIDFQETFADCINF